MPMNLRRKISLGIAVTLAATTMGVAGSTPAFAAGRVTSNGTCGDLLDMRVQRVGDPIAVTIVIPSIDPNEVWSITAIQQDYGATTGGRIGDPVDMTSSFPPLVFDPAEGGFVLDGGIVNNTEGMTHGISYTATRTSPSPATCTNTNGFWTNPFGAPDGPVSGNPTTRPDAPPLFAGESEAGVGTNDVLLLMDQEMLDNGLGIPATNRFTVTVNGIAQTVTAAQIVNDAPPNRAILDLTIATPIPSGATVTARYTRPLVSGQASLRDLEGLRTASFGPVNISVVGSSAAARSLSRRIG
jgi:hypothetical protein